MSGRVAGELERIAMIRDVLARAGSHGEPRIAGSPREVTLGIGDDAAVLDPSALRAGEALVWTVDASVEGVHWRRSLASMRDVGYRATVAATSDVLAMGGRPIAALAAWTIPDDELDASIVDIAEGQAEAAAGCGVDIIGGNIASGPALSITTTVIGAAIAPRRREGARAGDRIVVAGAVGEAGLGLAWLLGGRPPEGAPEVVAAWRRPPVLLDASRRLAVVATAMIDVSDGLAQDVGHIADASGVRAVLVTRRLASRRSVAARSAAAVLGVDAGRFELAAGEDYALVAAIPSSVRVPDGCDVIGFFEPGDGVEVEGDDGTRRVPPHGFRHGATTPSAPGRSG